MYVILYRLQFSLARLLCSLVGAPPLTYQTENCPTDSTGVLPQHAASSAFIHPGRKDCHPGGGQRRRYSSGLGVPVQTAPSKWCLFRIVGSLHRSFRHSRQCSRISGDPAHLLNRCWRVHPSAKCWLDMRPPISPLTGSIWIQRDLRCEGLSFSV